MKAKRAARFPTGVSSTNGCFFGGVHVILYGSISWVPGVSSTHEWDFWGSMVSIRGFHKLFRRRGPVSAFPGSPGPRLRGGGL